MRAVTSTNLADFAGIYDADVELVSVTPEDRPRMSDVAELSRRAIKARWSQTPGDRAVTDEQVHRAVESEASASLVDEIDSATQLMADLLGCTGVGIRVATLNGPMCPKFHVDYLPCRMIMTLMGPGTEWIAHDDVDREAFERRTNETIPVVEGKDVRHLRSGSWTLMKGGTWADDLFHGVVHRSPHYTGDRLLISIDPMFSRADA
ncbi:MAG: DUF1826 domain-containing protein [Pseudomonadota bacterium]